MENLEKLHVNSGILITRGVVGHSPGHSLSIGGILLTISLLSLLTYDILYILVVLCNVVAIYFLLRGHVYNISYDECVVRKSSYVFFYRTDITRIAPENIVLKIHENWISTKTFRLLVVDSEGDQHEIQQLKSDQLEDLGAEIARGLDIEFVIEDES